MVASYEHLLIDIADGIARVTINRPEVFNATNDVLHAELSRVWADLDADPAVMVILVTGAGDQAFSAGGDLNDIESRAALPSEERFAATMRVMKEAEAIVYGIVNCEKIVISAINGVAVGAGLAARPPASAPPRSPRPSVARVDTTCSPARFAPPPARR